MWTLLHISMKTHISRKISRTRKENRSVQYGQGDGFGLRFVAGLAEASEKVLTVLIHPMLDGSHYRGVRIVKTTFHSISIMRAVYIWKSTLFFIVGEYGVETYLELFSEDNFDAFCLAYMFTYRDFEGGTLGLAWTGDLQNAGGVCEKNGVSTWHVG